MNNISYRDFLKQEFDRRKRQNSRYSLRAFARDLGIPAPKLSQALRGVRGISTDRAISLASALRLKPDEKNLFVALVESEHGRSQTQRQLAEEKVAKIISTQGYSEIDLIKFKIVSDWHHFAILELCNVKSFKSDPEWIAEKIGIDVQEANDAISRLVETELLEKNENGELKRTHVDFATPTGIPSIELRKRHSQILRKAQDALESVSIKERDFSTMTVAVDPSDLEEAAQWIKDFRRRFSKNLEKSPNKSRIYNLSVEFFPLDKM